MIFASLQLMVRVGELPAPAHGPAPLADRRHPLSRRRLHHLALPRHPPGRHLKMVFTKHMLFLHLHKLSRLCI